MTLPAMLVAMRLEHILAAVAGQLPLSPGCPPYVVQRLWAQTVTLAEWHGVRKKVVVSHFSGRCVRRHLWCYIYGAGSSVPLCIGSPALVHFPRPPDLSGYRLVVSIWARVSGFSCTG